AELVAVKERYIGCVEQARQRGIKPTSRAQPQPKKRLRVLGNLWPAACGIAGLGDRTQPRRDRVARDIVKRSAHRRDAVTIPGWWPIATAEILQHQHRMLSVLVGDHL